MKVGGKSRAKRHPRDSAEGHVQVTHCWTWSPAATQASALGRAEA